MGSVYLPLPPPPAAVQPTRLPSLPAGRHAVADGGSGGDGGSVIIRAVSK